MHYVKLMEIIFKPFISYEIHKPHIVTADRSDFPVLGVSILLFGILPDLQFAYKVLRHIKLFINREDAYLYNFSEDQMSMDSKI